jgi:DNA-binding MarR family transcriptional regulator
MQATKVRTSSRSPTSQRAELEKLADALRDVVLVARRRAARSAQDTSVVALLAHLMTLGPLRAGDLAERACLDPSTVSRHLRTLEVDGCLVRTPDPEDGRATLLQVTPHGAQLVAKARSERLGMLSDAVADWSEKDVVALTRLTRRLADSLESL